MKKLIRPIYHLLRLFFKLNLFKTIYFNLKMFPLKIALKFPVFVYGKIKFYSLSGKIIFNCPIKTGTVQIGKLFDGFPATFLPVALTINDTVIFNGPVIISGGTSLTIWHGTFELGKYCTIGSGVTIRCYSGIKIGDYTRIIGGCTVMDTNVHFIRNTVTGVIKKLYDKIEIGKYCWVNMGVVVSKGTVLPDYCIVARNSFLNKDYSAICKPASLLVGNPVKVKTENVQRIFSIREEKKVIKYFNENPDATEYKSDPGIIEDGEGVKDLFKLL